MARHGPRHLRRLHPERRAVRRRPALRPRRQVERAKKLGYIVNTGPELEFFLFRRGEDGDDRAAAARPGRLLRLLDRPRAGGPPGHGRRARGVRHQGRGRAPRGGRRPARDRLRVLRRAAHGRQRDHLQVHAEGDRPAARPVRDVHAQADPRHQRLRHAHPPVALSIADERNAFADADEPVRPVRRRPLVHGRDPGPRPRHDRRPRAAGELVQAAGARLRGADLPDLGADQPLRAHPRADGVARQVDRGRRAARCAARIRRRTRTSPSRR